MYIFKNKGGAESQTFGPLKYFKVKNNCDDHSAHYTPCYSPKLVVFSAQSPDSVFGLLGNDGSKSDFGRVCGTSPLCLGRDKEQMLNKLY